MIEQVCCEGLDDRVCFMDVGGVLTDSKYQNLFFCPHLLSAVWKDCSDVDLAAADVGPDEAFDVEVICHSMDVVGEASLTSRAFKGGELERSLLGHEAHVLRPEIMPFKKNTCGPDHTILSATEVRYGFFIQTKIKA